jgi:biopolymer transport protein ExbB/TolQ
MIIASTLNGSKKHDYLPTGGGRDMEYVNLVSKIVAAEETAQEIAREAREKQSSLDSDLKRDVEALREDCFARARNRVALVEETERAAAGETMSEWDAKLSRAMAEVERAYTKGRDSWVDLLFHKIIGE